MSNSKYKTAKKRYDWLRWNTENGKFECTRCGYSYLMNLPCPINIVLAAIKEFKKDHQTCKEKKL